MHFSRLFIPFDGCCKFFLRKQEEKRQIALFIILSLLIRIHYKIRIHIQNRCIDIVAVRIRVITYKERRYFKSRVSCLIYKPLSISCIIYVFKGVTNMLQCATYVCANLLAPIYLSMLNVYTLDFIKMFVCDKTNG